MLHRGGRIGHVRCARAHPGAYYVSTEPFDTIGYGPSDYRGKRPAHGGQPDSKDEWVRDGMDASHLGDHGRVINGEGGVYGTGGTINDTNENIDDVRTFEEGESEDDKKDEKDEDEMEEHKQDGTHEVADDAPYASL